jgi:group I intron endonuclease
MTPTRFTIYCHTNKVNGKRYIGQTVCSMEKRWSDHVITARNGAGCRVFGAAIRKYGPESFDHEVLEVVTGAQAEADKAESKWIVQLRSRAPEGYNLAVGGGGNGRHHEDSKRLMSELAGRRLREMSSEQRTKHFKNLKTPARLVRLREVSATNEYRNKMAAKQATFTSSQKRAVGLKAWATRRARYGEIGRVKAAGKYSRDNSKKGWDGMTPEARAERVQKIKEGVRKAIEAKKPNLVLINLLRAP